MRMLKHALDGPLVAMAFVLVMLCAPPLPAGASPQAAQAPEDPQLRARAVGLLERAVRLSSPVWPMNEEFFTFHIPNPEPGAATDGSIRIGVGRPDLKRLDVVYGAYQFSQVHNGMEYATVKIVSGWTFHPAQCNYEPTSEQRNFVVHFRGWQ
jgi:hypothetical protein